MFSDIWLVMYLADIVGDTKGFLEIISVLSIMVSICGIVMSHIEESETAKKFAKWSFLTFVICAFFAIFLPSKKVIYFYTGGKAIDSAIESAKESGIPEKALNTLNNVFDKIDRELEDEK